VPCVIGSGLENTSDGGRLEKYFEKVFEPLEKTIFPVGVCGGDVREAFGAVNYEVLRAVRYDTKKGKMFLESACQVLLRLVVWRLASSELVWVLSTECGDEFGNRHEKRERSQKGVSESTCLFAPSRVFLWQGEALRVS